MKKLLKWFVVILLLGGAAAGGAWWYFNGAQNQAPTYETVEVGRGHLVVSVSATGTLNPVATVLVGSQVSGRVESLKADFNSVVKRGQVIAQLEPSQFVSKVRQTEAALAKARANTKLAKTSLDRQQSLSRQKLISEEELDNAQAKYEQSVAEEMQAQALLDSARIDLEHATIYSPVDGVVLTRAVDVGQTVAASLQTPTLFTIAADLTQMQIEAKVDEADVGQVAVGQAVNFTVDAYADLTFTGVVRQVRNSPEIVQNVVTYNTIITVANPALKLKPGMTANVTIIVAERTDALRLPNAALRFKPPQFDQWLAKMMEQRGKGGAGGGGAGAKGAKRRAGPQLVFALVEGQPKPLRVKTGLTDGSFTEALEGVEEKQKVIVGQASAKPAAAAVVNPFAAPRLPGAKK